MTFFSNHSQFWGNSYHTVRGGVAACITRHGTAFTRVNVILGIYFLMKIED